jgi:hypothetical protein
MMSSVANVAKRLECAAFRRFWKVYALCQGYSAGRRRTPNASRGPYHQNQLHGRARILAL